MPNYSETLEFFLGRVPFEVYSLDETSVRTQSGYNCNPDPFAPAKPFVTTLIPMRESIQARLAIQAPGTSFARFVEHEHDRACASITGISTGTHPGITFGNPPRDPNAPPAKAGDAEVKKDAQIMVYNKKPDGEMFVVLLYTRFFRESIAGLQLTADQWYALSGKFVPDLCGLMLGTVQAKPTDECTPTIEFEYCDGVCKAGVTLNPDLMKMIPAIGVPCSLAVAKRVYESKKVAPAMMTERFNLTFARAINVLTCDAREAKLCLDFPGMQFFFISNFTDLTSKQIELATKLSDDEFFTIFMETGRNKDESLLLGYKNLAEGVENTRDAPRIPAAAAVFAMLPEGHPGRSGPLLNTIDPNMVRALAQMQPKAPAPAPAQVQDTPPAQEEIPAPAPVHEAPAPPVTTKPAKKAKTSGSA